ncbi:MAG: DUF433 domain-containing protein [Planctomycetes bacterium]|nr:DUF433 domain-containing protein [Planctomycetota bacterium]
MSTRKAFDVNEILAHQDPREMPVYSIPEAAHYLSIPPATLRSWVLGRGYHASGEHRRFKRVIKLPHRDTNLLSFFNLVEAHVLRAFRTDHKIRLKHIRLALNYVMREFGWERPLIEQEFQTDGVGLLVQRLGKLIDASADGQTVMKHVVEAHLKRLEWEDNVVSCLYPFTRVNDTDSPRSVLIDPRFSFGRPILQQSRVETTVIAERYKAGDSIDSLADDYACPRLEIEEGLRCELSLQDAA